MENRIRPTRSGLFAIELIISIGVFVTCASACIGLFVRSETMSRSDADLVKAVGEARNVSECFKAFGGDVGQTARKTEAGIQNGNLVLFYDGQWNRTGKTGRGAVFRLEVSDVEKHGRHTTASLAVFGEHDDPILSWDISAREAAS